MDLLLVMTHTHTHTHMHTITHTCTHSNTSVTVRSAPSLVNAVKSSWQERRYYTCCNSYHTPAQCLRAQTYSQTKFGLESTNFEFHINSVAYCVFDRLFLRRCRTRDVCNMSEYPTMPILPNAMWSLTLFVELYFYLFQLEDHQLHQCKVQECLVCKLEVSIFTVEEFGSLATTGL